MAMVDTTAHLDFKGQVCGLCARRRPPRRRMRWFYFILNPVPVRYTGTGSSKSRTNEIASFSTRSFSTYRFTKNLVEGFQHASPYRDEISVTPSSNNNSVFSVVRSSNSNHGSSSISSSVRKVSRFQEELSILMTGSTEERRSEVLFRDVVPISDVCVALRLDCEPSGGAVEAVSG